MIEIDKTILSLDIFEKYFQCNLDKCKGMCCIDGDSGAPLEQEELKQLENNFEAIKKYLPKINLTEIEKQGFYIIDDDGDYVTPCVENMDCAYLIYENGISMCAFEKAYLKKEIKFRKPISCHLYPIRITEYGDFDAINYDERMICVSGRILGKNNNILLYQFLKDALIRKYGIEWYNKLVAAANIIQKQNKK